MEELLIKACMEAKASHLKHTYVLGKMLQAMHYSDLISDTVYKYLSCRLGISNTPNKTVPVPSREQDTSCSDTESVAEPDLSVVQEHQVPKLVTRPPKVIICKKWIYFSALADRLESNNKYVHWSVNHSLRKVTFMFTDTDDSDDAVRIYRQAHGGIRVVRHERLLEIDWIINDFVGKKCERRLNPITYGGVPAWVAYFK